MQPYFSPYIGYFQLINSVDTFIIYDNIQYTKKGWINRNRFLLDGKEALFSISLKKDSDYLDVRDRLISSEFNRKKLLNKIYMAYKKSCSFEDVFPLFEKIISNNEMNLFEYIYFSIIEICSYLNIETKIVKSSDIDINHSLKSQDKVISLCRKMEATTYLNPIGGQSLYSKEYFKECGISLNFIKSNPVIYKQFNDVFVPWLSILDVMMFNERDAVRK